MSSAPSLPLCIAHAIDTVNHLLGRTCAWLTLFLVLGTTVVVVPVSYTHLTLPTTPYV